MKHATTKITRVIALNKDVGFERFPTSQVVVSLDFVGGGCHLWRLIVKLDIKD